MKKLALLLSLSAAALAFSLTEYPPQIKIESESQQGLSTLVVQTDIKDADVYVNLFYKGTAPVTLSGLKPDTYFISIRKQGYKERNLSLSLAPNTKTTVYMNLIPYVGYLSIDSPQDISIKIGDNYYDEGVIELPVGSYNASVRAFGYEPETVSFDIYQNSTTFRSVSLTQAEFRVDNAGFSNTRFNPRNAGLYGSAVFRFEVSTYGYAEFSVADANGIMVASWQSPRFETWTQEIRWDGKDETGALVQDGVYHVTVTFYDLVSGTPVKTSWLFEYDINVDSTLVLYPSLLAGPVPGPSFAQPALAVSEPDFLVAMGASYDTLGSFDSFGAIFFMVKASATLPGFGRIALAAAVGSEPDFLNGSLGVLVPAYSAGLFTFGVSGSGMLRSVALGGSYASVGLPTTVGTKQLAFTASPILALFWQESIALRGMFEASLLYASYSYCVALSANLLTTDLLSQTFGIELPVTATLDAAFLPPESYIELSFWASMRFSAESSALSAGFLTAFRLFGEN